MMLETCARLAACSTTATCSRWRHQQAATTAPRGNWFDAYLYIPYLSRYTNQQQPLLLHIYTIVDDLTAGEARVTVEHFLRLRITYDNHTSVCDGEQTTTKITPNSLDDQDHPAREYHLNQSLLTLSIWTCFITPP